MNAVKGVYADNNKYDNQTRGVEPQPESLETALVAEIERLDKMRSFASTTLDRLEKFLDRVNGPLPQTPCSDKTAREPHCAREQLRWTITDLSEIVARINQQVDRLTPQ